jgi:hypothetical protein
MFPSQTHGSRSIPVPKLTKKKRKKEKKKVNPGCTPRTSVVGHNHSTAPPAAAAVTPKGNFWSVSGALEGAISISR